jgi:outer membrane biosynthesis protein TonB
VHPPLPPPPEARGDSPLPVDRSQWYEATLRDPYAMPVYPARALKAKAGRNTVGVHIVVDASGHVSEIRTSMFVFSTPGPFAEDFRDAVEVAVRQWRFNPARTEQYEIVHDGEATDMRVKGSENVETEFDLAFTFQPDGTVRQGEGK